MSTRILKTAPSLLKGLILNLKLNLRDLDLVQKILDRTSEGFWDGISGGFPVGTRPIVWILPLLI